MGSELTDALRMAHTGLQRATPDAHDRSWYIDVVIPTVRRAIVDSADRDDLAARLAAAEARIAAVRALVADAVAHNRREDPDMPIECVPVWADQILAIIDGKPAS